MSTKKTATKTAVAVIETAERPEKIRNIALVGHSAAGKTTLVEALLAATGTIGRAGTVTEGTTVSDADPVEVAQQRSVVLSVCPLRHDDIVITCSTRPDTPTSPASCGPGCAPRTRPCSSCRPPTTSTPSPCRSGRNARRSARLGRWS